MSYFSRVTLNPSRANVDRLAHVVSADGYREHQALWRLFNDDPNATRDFLFRRDDLYHGLRYFVVSNRMPQDASGLWQIETKDYAPIIEAGRRFAFSLRANPVVSRKDENGRSHRHDIVLDAKKHGDKSEKVSGQQHNLSLAQQVGAEWLKSRGKNNGFALDESNFLVEGYRQVKGQKQGRDISYSMLDFTGTLRVDDPVLFQQALTKGIGPAKAFGCGLLLIRRA